MKPWFYTLQCNILWVNINFSLYSWAEANIPLYCKIAGDHARPYLELAWDVCLVVGHQLHTMYENVHAYVEEKTPAVIKFVSHLNLFLATAYVLPYWISVFLWIINLECLCLFCMGTHAFSFSSFPISLYMHISIIIVHIDHSFVKVPKSK